MSEDEGFLRGILAAPEDDELRLVYADWLEERGDPRAEYVRVELQSREQKKRRAADPLQKQLRELEASLDAGWVAFMTTLACPFEPRLFECRSEELPFTERIGSRGRLMTFESQFRDERTWDAGLMQDLTALLGPDWGQCCYGARSCPMYPFLCEARSARERPRGSDILAALKARDFQSEHIETLDADAIPYPGYHPGTRNDEIHTDFSGQYLFAREVETGVGDVPLHEDAGNHGILRGHVLGRRLWYVLLHAGARPSRFVLLFAVGRSPHGARLAGVVTHQVCHNLCD